MTGPTTGPPAVVPTVVVAVLTYRRPAELAALLPELVAQADALEVPATVLVVDNDPDAPALAAADPHGGPQAVAAAAGADHRWEPRAGIAAARNTALDAAAGRGARALVFVDDDERPCPGWLAHLVGTWSTGGADAVVGPVVSTFEAEPGPWVAAGGFFERRRPPTGTRVDVAATNNLLLDLAAVQAAGVRFDERFGLSGGSDTLFTRRLHAAGAVMLWCDQALVTDRVPASRTTARWVLARALRSGNSWARTSVAMTRGVAGTGAGAATRPAVRSCPGAAAVGRTAVPARSSAGRTPTAAVRAALVGRGGVRVLGGGARLAAGTVLRAVGGGPRHQARGLRTLARGVGMVGGALGWTYVEYRRPARPRSAPAP